MTGSEFLSFLARYRKTKSNGRMQELLDRFELYLSQKSGNEQGHEAEGRYSGGFMHDASVLILDEPQAVLTL